MNTKNNQRSRNTDERIVRATFELSAKENRPLNRITVREICEVAQINRSTFYAHYMDVYDVVEKAERTMAEELTKSFTKELSKGKKLDTCFVSLFSFVKENKEFYKLYLSSSSRSGTIGIAWDMLHEWTESISYHQFGYKNEEEMKYHGEFFINGLSAMLRRWVELDCPESPQQMYEYLKRQHTPRINMF